MVRYFNKFLTYCLFVVHYITFTFQVGVVSVRSAVLRLVCRSSLLNFGNTDEPFLFLSNYYGGSFPLPSASLTRDGPNVANHLRHGFVDVEREKGEYK